MGDAKKDPRADKGSSLWTGLKVGVMTVPASGYLMSQIDLLERTSTEQTQYVLTTQLQRLPFPLVWSEDH
jgi:hypothetical protein